MYASTPEQYLGLLKEQLKKEIEKVNDLKQNVMNQNNHEHTCQYRDIEKRLVNFICSLEIGKQDEGWR